jgi:hypothetical protein
MRSAFRTFFDDATALRSRLGPAAIAAIVLLCPAMPAAAQDARAAGEACARIADSLERLICYDREFRPNSAAESSASLPAAPAGVAPSPSPSPAPAASAAAAPPAAATPAAASAAAASSTPPPAAAAPTATAPAAAAPATAAPAENQKDAEVPIVVVSISELRGGDARFSTKDGQLWIQTDGRRNVYPTVPFDAVIRPGAMGSAFLVPPSGRGVRVRRGP